MIRALSCIALLLMLSVSACSPATQSAKLPSVSSGLEGFELHMSYADRYVQEGDYESALAELQSAKTFNDEHPALYEMLGIVYDAQRDNENAFDNFLRAGRMYRDAGDSDRGMRVIGWLKTIKSTPDVQQLEQEIRAL